MIRIVRDFTNWPRTKGKDPIFTDAGDAIFYAHLIIDNVSERSRIVKLRRKVLFDLKVMRASEHPNMQRMFDLSVKGQLYRECLEELERIEKEGN
ncbi:hypothetical protein ES702_02944 [subsurface metagenome]